MIEKISLSLKRRILSNLTKKSISSVTAVQDTMNKLVSVNDQINKTAHEIEEIESNFSLIKGELNQRKAKNDLIIEQIKSIEY